MLSNASGCTCCASCFRPSRAIAIASAGGSGVRLPLGGGRLSGTTTDSGPRLRSHCSLNLRSAIVDLPTPCFAARARKDAPCFSYSCRITCHWVMLHSLLFIVCNLCAVSLFYSVKFVSNVSRRRQHEPA